jgi:hypothetical protein
MSVSRRAGRLMLGFANALGLAVGGTSRTVAAFSADV